LSTAIIIGAGSKAGLGAALARRFAKDGLRVIIAARTAKNLEELAASIREQGGTVETKVTDASFEPDVQALFDLGAAGGDLELVVYNAGGNATAPALETDAALFESLWRQNALGGFLAGREAARKMLAQGKGTIIFTGATASIRARPPFLGFASAKAALRAVAQGLAREFGPKGLHVAHVIIDGVINGDYAREKFPDFVRTKGEEGLIDPDAIAESFLALHRQPRSAWTHELDLRPFKEAF
jgi:NAD(P)-dependent dehydrogenase (short-subunit alcohol dehydrogenase family)